MSEIEPNGLSKNLGQRLPAGLRKYNRELKAQGKIPVIDTPSRSLSQARELYTTITQQLSDSPKMPLAERVVLEVRQVWLRALLPNLPPEDTLSSVERVNELKRIMQPPEIKAYLGQNVGEVDGKPLTRSAMLRDEIEILLRHITHRGHK